MHLCFRLLVLVIVATWTPLVAAEPPELIPVHPNLLQELERLRQRENAEIAADVALRLTLREGAGLVPHPTEPGLFWPMRQALQRYLAEEKPPWQARYEAALALRHSLRLKQRGNDLGVLFQVVDEGGGETTGGKGLQLLGDLLLAEGRTWEAEHSYESALAHGQPGNVAALRARLVLSALYQGNGPEAAARHQHFLSEYPDSEGELAGERGLLSKRLSDLARSYAATQAPATSHRWLGNPRNELQFSRLIEHPSLRGAERRVGDWLVSTQHGALHGFSLLHGKLRTWLPAPQGGEARTSPATMDAQGFTVAFRTEKGTLACCDLQDDGRLLWSHQPRQAEAAYAGNPVIAKERVFALVTRVEGPEVVTALACHHLVDGAERWQAPLWRVAARGAVPAHLEIVAAGRAIVAVSTAGVAVAVDHQTGQALWGRTWAVKPAKPSKESDPSRRRLLAVHGRIYRSEPVRDLVEAWDVLNGRLLWQQPLRGQIGWLGTTPSLAILELEDGLVALDATGHARWAYPLTGKLTGQGQGVCHQGKVWWPTDAGWHVLDAGTGRLLVDPVELDHLPLGDAYVDDTGIWVRRAERCSRFGPGAAKEPS